MTPELKAIIHSIRAGEQRQGEAPKPWAYDFWEFMQDEHGLTLLESEMQDILRAAEPFTRARPDAASDLTCAECGTQMVPYCAECGYNDAESAAEPVPPATWRMLEVGEKLQNDDQVISRQTGEWITIHHLSGPVLPGSEGRFRRRVAPAETPRYEWLRAEELPNVTKEELHGEYLRVLVQHDRDAALRRVGELAAINAELERDRGQALARQAELMQLLADIHSLATSPALAFAERLSAIADRTRPHHTPV